jgi:transposase
MPYKHNEPRRHKIPKAKYKASNWREYDQALQQRGSLMVWVTPEALVAWVPEKTGRRGRPTSYADIVIETAVMLRLASLVGPLLDQIDGPVSAMLADGAYDGEPTYQTILDRHPDATVVIPPRSNAVLSDIAETEPTQRDRHIQLLARKGRISWQKAVGYGKRSLVEMAFYRYKVLIDRSLRARTLSPQKVEARIACKVINRMTSLGMPISRKVA